VAYEDDRHFGRPGFEEALANRFEPESRDVLRLAAQLCSIPGVTVPASAADLNAVARAYRAARDYAAGRGLRLYERAPEAGCPYPYLVVTFRELDLESAELDEVVVLIGHLDVVAPHAEDQLSPFLRGVDLHARGAADMKTVVATYLVWMGRLQQQPGPKPPFVLLLSCCEENGSERPHHTLSVIRWLHDELGVRIRFGLVGERTGELEWMDDGLQVGPICRENRSWRWFRAQTASPTGRAALGAIAEAAALGRQTIARLNAERPPESSAQRQPGVRSGFLNPFTFVAGDSGYAGLTDAASLTVDRGGGAASHSAVVDPSQPALVERFHSVVERVAGAFGSADLLLGGVEIGQDSNYNTYDGSGTMWLSVQGANRELLVAWAEKQDLPGLSLRVGSPARPARVGPTVVGLELRELLCHREAAAGLLSELRARLWGDAFEVVNDRPAWHCPEDQPDLVRLEAAYEAVIGAASPHPVKLHGNDGGSLVAWQQATRPELAERGLGHAVVFGQVGRGPHGARELHRGTSIAPYVEILDRWARSYLET